MYTVHVDKLFDVNLSADNSVCTSTLATYMIHPPITCAVYEQVSDSNRVTGDVLPSELGGHGVLLPERPVLMLHMHRKHWRMVTHLGEGEGRRGGWGGGRRRGKGDMTEVSVTIYYTRNSL